MPLLAKEERNDEDFKDLKNKIAHPKPKTPHKLRKLKFLTGVY